MNIERIDMKKLHYKKELVLSSAQKRFGSNRKAEVRKIQSWLCLHDRINGNSLGITTAIDGDFGAATERSVMRYQVFMDMNSDGIVTQDLFTVLSKPIKTAFSKVEKATTLRETILKVAKNHLEQRPCELVINKASNSGPWVRAYMGGHNGELWYWCMGFVQTIIDQSFALHGKKITEMMPITYSCDTVGNKALEINVLMRNAIIKNDISLIKPGDILLIRKSTYDWTHTAIIIEVYKDSVLTIEGNTNDDGSRNGDGVYMRTRNFRKSKLDVFSIEKWCEL